MLFYCVVERRRLLFGLAKTIEDRGAEGSHFSTAAASTTSLSNSRIRIALRTGCNSRYNAPEKDELALEDLIQATSRWHVLGTVSA